MRRAVQESGTVRPGGARSPHASGNRRHSREARVAGMSGVIASRFPNAEDYLLSSRAWRRSQRSLRRNSDPNVLGAETETDQTSGEASNRREAADQSKHQRQLEVLSLYRERMPVESALDHAILHSELEALCEASRQRSALLHLPQVAIRQSAFAQRRRQRVGGGDRVLDRKVDPDAANRRHRMRRVADTQQARAIPLR